MNLPVRDSSASKSKAFETPESLPIHVTLLASYIPPHQLESYLAYAARFDRLSILLSTAMESHRGWSTDWGTLDVQVLKGWTFARRWKHRVGFTDAVDIHLPINAFRRLLSLSPDVVVACELGARSFVSSLYTMIHFKKPLVLWACVSEHTEQGRGLSRRIIRGWLMRRASAVIVNGASGRRYIEGLGVQPDKIFEIPYCTPVNFFDQCSLERNEGESHRLVCVGQLIERKGVERLIHQLSYWATSNPERHVELAIVGDGPLLESLKEIPLPKNLQIDFLGKKTHEELIQIYSGSGILVFPTLADEWGLVVNEAMAAGLPVLGSLYSGAVEELCHEGQTGWVFRVDHDQELLDAIDRVLNTSVERLNDMRKLARERVANITPETCADIFRQVVRGVLENRSRKVR